VEEIKQKAYELLEISTSFYVRTYQSDHIDGHRLKAILNQVRTWCIERKKTHEIKVLWCMIILLLEDRGDGLTKEELLRYLSKEESPSQVPESLRATYGNFGYNYTLSRSLDEVLGVLAKDRWVQKDNNKNYRLTVLGKRRAKMTIRERRQNPLHIAAYGEIDKAALLHLIDHP
jgi:hypothetical protein